MQHSQWDEMHVRGDVPHHAIRINHATHGHLQEREDWPAGELPQIDQMRWARWVQAEAAQMVEAAVIEAREHRVTWAEIGDVFGMSKQAAQQRYGHLDRS